MSEPNRTRAGSARAAVEMKAARVARLPNARRRHARASLDAFWRIIAVLVALAPISCEAPVGDASEAPPVGTVRQPLTDTDGDGLDDAWETTHFGNLSQTAAGDYDADGMTNLEEYTHGFVPTVDDGFEDADGDRYPNVFEVRRGSDPNAASSTPTANFVVDGSGGGTHTTVSAAVSAANLANGAYQIIGIAPGTYTGAANDITLPTSKPKLLIIGLQGAATTIIDGVAGGNGDTWGWTVNNSAVIASLTFRRWSQAIWVNAPGLEVRLVDLVVRDNGNPQWAGAVDLATNAKAQIVGSTFINNVGGSPYGQIYVNNGATATLRNTVVWGQAGTMLAKGSTGTVGTSHCLVKGQTLTGTGNLAGTTDPKLRPDGRLLWDSPLRGAGGLPQSRVDMDGELRPSASPDIGADQFVDSDADDVADSWEQAETGGLITLTGRTQDSDGDGLTNEQEYNAGTKPTVLDTDGDGVSDGNEVTVHGSNPLMTDTDGDEMPDGWEVTYGLSPTVANAFDDADGDRYPNIFEYARGSNPADIQSTPAPNYVVDGAGGGTHTTISAGLNAANVANGAYQIIGIAPGTYTGAANDITLPTSKPKLLIIGLQGAATTIIDGVAGGNGDTWGWTLNNSAVIASLTFRRWSQAIWVNAPGLEVRLVDLVVRDNGNPQWAGAVDLATNAKAQIVGSTFINNVGGSPYGQIYVNNGATATLRNTVVWGQAGTMLAKGSTGAVATSHCLVKGQTLTGTGNLAGTTDPKLRPDGRLLWDSALRGAGGLPQSRVDMDGELRPSASPDIGADQFVDSDADDLADAWEQSETAGLATLTGRTQDTDGDGLTNEQEYSAGTKPTVTDTDGDGVSDGNEVTLHGSDPLKTDTDGDEMPDGWEITYGLSPSIANAFEDADGDRYPNIFEYARSSNPSDSSSTPAANFVVNAAGGGTHTTIGDAVNAANIANGAYQIIAVAPGTYKGWSNVGLTFGAAKPKFLVIGLEGADKTIIDGELVSGAGWALLNAGVISSLTLTRMGTAIWIDATGAEVRLVDLLVRNNVRTGYPAAVNVHRAARTFITGSTFLDNTGTGLSQQIYIGWGAGTVTNTAVSTSGSGTLLSQGGGVTLTSNNSFVKGQTLAGTGNVAGNVDPKIRADGHIRWDSPLRATGRAVAQSRIDMDGEARPTSSPDIGVDQFFDSDADNLADAWEAATAGNLTTLTGRTQDADGDGLTNENEHLQMTSPVVGDTDGDGVSDGDEVSVHGSNPLNSDTDGDGMPDAWEITYGLSPTFANAFEDADGDRYPNIFEYARSSNPSDRSSTPTANFVVNATGGGTHTSISAAVSAANAQPGAYQIIGVAPGVYAGTWNTDSVDLYHGKLLLIGLEGAGRTIIDGGGVYGWEITHSVVVSSLTFRNFSTAIVVGTGWSRPSDVRLVDLIVRDNVTDQQRPSAVNTLGGLTRLHIAGSTFIDNNGASWARQIYVGDGIAASITNTVVWGGATGTMLAKSGSATLTTSHSLVKGQTLSGTGNLPGTTDPRFRSADLHLRWDSPLRGAGGTIAQSRIDIDGDLRPSSAPDIGVDQFNDSDGDGLPDQWEVARFGNTSSASGTSDNDNDSLNNLGEYDRETDPLNPDTDGDLVPDGIELIYGLNPLRVDADEIASDLNGDGVLDSLNYQLGFPPSALDTDGDGITNANEALMCTNPFRADTDGDGVADNVDRFPLDPLMSVMPSDPDDAAAPIITLTAPWYAVEQ